MVKQVPPGDGRKMENLDPRSGQTAGPVETRLRVTRRTGACQVNTASAAASQGQGSPEGGRWRRTAHL